MVVVVVDVVAVVAVVAAVASIEDAKKGTNFFERLLPRNTNVS